MTGERIISINRKNNSSSFLSICLSLHKCIVSHSMRISIGSLASVIGIALVYPSNELRIVLKISRTYVAYITYTV